MNLIHLIWKNAIRNRRRTMLTILSIAVSMFLVSTLQAILANLYRTDRNKGSSSLSLVVHRATSITQALPESARDKIKSVPGVEAAVGQSWFGGQYIDASNFFANFAAQTDEFERVYTAYHIPPDQLAAWKSERTAALVGRKLMDTYHWKIGDRITLKGTIYPFNPELIIRAVYTDPEDERQERALYFHYKYLDEAMGRFGQIGNVSVKVASAPDVPRVADAIDAMFRNTAYETKTETVEAFQLSFVSMLGNVKLLFTAVTFAVMFTILFVVGNTMAMSIRERTGEVAVLKTVGFQRNTILLLLAGEAAVIAMLGGALGAFGAKLAYAFIQVTYVRARMLGLAFGAVGASVTGYGVWSLFAGTAAHGWLKVLRFAASFVGALVGFVALFGFYLAVGFVTNQAGFLSGFAVPLQTVALCLGFAAAIGLVSAALPALRASRTSIADALRFVG
jgi:putative ABC transport system permease protein